MRILRQSIFALFAFLMSSWVVAACLPQPDLEKALSRADFKAAQDGGYLWKIEKMGHVSYLYGTMHVLPESLLIPGLKTMEAFKQSDVLALELNVLDPKLLTEVQTQLKKAPDLMRVNAAQQEKMQKIAQSLCVPDTLTASTPWSFKYMQLAIAKMRESGLEALYGREIFLAIFAQGIGKPVVSLESAQTQINALTQGWNVPSDVVDKYVEQLAGSVYPQVINQMLDTWRANNLEKMAAYDQWCQCADAPEEKQLLSQMNDARNPAMAVSIDKLHASGKRVFAAIGALHMTGPQALPKLLEQKGYQVTRIF